MLKINVTEKELIVYIVTEQDYGLKLALESLDDFPVKKVIFKKGKAAFGSISAGALFIVFDDAHGISLLEDLRLREAIDLPALVLSFRTHDKTELRFAKSARLGASIIKFSRGTYHIQLPCKLEEISAVIKSATSVSKTEMKRLLEEHTFTLRYRDDTEFRHSCANLTSALRILQGAYYAGDLNDEKYLSAIDDLKKVVRKIPSLTTYLKNIKDYSVKIRKNYDAFLKETDFPKAKGLSIKLLDDEAVTAGWDVVLGSIFRKQGYTFSIETNRDKFLTEIETEDSLGVDILLLEPAYAGQTRKKHCFG